MISKALLAAIGLYQSFISPFKGPTCRYTPTCSEYAAEAIRTWGPRRGLVLTARRIARCCPAGGCGDDPVPTPHGDKI